MFVEFVREPIVHGDSRKLKQLLKGTPEVQCTISSPPYGTLVSYGSVDEIGANSLSFGDYVRELKTVFQQVYDITRSDGTCWIIIDGYTEGRVARFLPGQMWAVMEEIGWKGIDVIVWKKNKNRPYSRQRFRNTFEYILVFAKDPTKCKYHVDRIAEPHTFKARWFSGWPERYSLNGKVPSDVWEIDIPDQGSWTDKDEDAVGWRHFCPFPVELVSRIVEVSSDVGDVVFDPFAGSGVVPRAARLAGRKGIGIEVVEQYVKGGAALQATFEREYQAYERRRELERQEIELERHELVRLRVIKAAKALAKASRAEVPSVEAILAQVTGEEKGTVNAEFIFVGKKVKLADVTPLGQNPIFSQANIIPIFKTAKPDWLDAQAFGRLWVIDRVTRDGRVSVEQMHFQGISAHGASGQTPLVVTTFFARRFMWRESPMDISIRRTKERAVAKAMTDARNDRALASRLLGISLMELDDILTSIGGDSREAGSLLTAATQPDEE